MIIRANEIEDGAVLETDVCVIGSGPAGLAVAQRLDGKVPVLLLESGGLEFDAKVQDLYRGSSIGRSYFSLESCRQRYFGGSSNCWAGLCRPLEPEDFEARPWVPHSGWPFGRAELEPWYAEAEQFLGLRGPGWDLAKWSINPRKAWTFSDPRVVTSFFKLSAPIRLGTTLRPALTASTGVRVVLEASVTRLVVAGGRLDRLEVKRSLGGGGFTVRPRRVVLATGGLENPRLLLASEVGGDLVGRYFMEHPHTDGEGLLLGSPGLPPDGFYHRHTHHRQPIWGCFMISAETRAREGLLSSATVLLGGKKDPLIEPLRRTLADTDGGQLPEKATVFTFGTPSEQSPDPESRVLLDGERDALGMARLRLDWRLTRADQQSVARTHEILAEAFAHAGLGRVKLTLRPTGEFPAHMNGGRHHLGTTRMHTDPKQGVVNADARVHGLENLYIAGSSVFPTGGSANPTLTLTALARRLAAHLEKA